MNPIFKQWLDEQYKFTNPIGGITYYSLWTWMDVLLTRRYEYKFH
jgi:hypothetical protein